MEGKREKRKQDRWRSSHFCISQKKTGFLQEPFYGSGRNLPLWKHFFLQTPSGHQKHFSSFSNETDPASEAKTEENVEHKNYVQKGCLPCLKSETTAAFGAPQLNGAEIIPCLVCQDAHTFFSLSQPLIITASQKELWAAFFLVLLLLLCSEDVDQQKARRNRYLLTW